MDCIDMNAVRKNASDFCTFLWNGETKEFLGRGKRSWLEITVFYIIFFGVLSAFFISTIIVFHKTIDDVEPKLQGDSSLLRGNPGLGFRPMPDIRTTLIHASNDSKMIAEYVNNTNKILDKYINQINAVDCSNMNETRPLAKDHCYFNISALTEHCNEENGYGLLVGQPCVLLKLNKVFGWTPNPWTKNEIQMESRVPSSIKDVYSPSQIWVHCHGENPGDVDNLGHASEIKYYPQQGFPVAYYPYLNQKNYRSPLVFVQFRNLTKHVGIMVECIALDRNINVDKKDKEGSIHFELMTDW